MLIASVAMIVGIALLVWSADKFVDGASGIAKNFQVPTLVIGLTIVSFCTSLPEMLVSLLAAINGNNNLGIGNAIGSNIANIGLVLGATALISPLAVESKLFRREIPVLFAIMLLALGLMWDEALSFGDGLLLLLGLFALIYWLFKLGTSERDAQLEAEFADIVPQGFDMPTSVKWLVIGLVVLLLSSRLVVWGAVQMATLLGVSDLVIGLTIVAIGTSLPELVASIVSVFKGESELAIGNVIGSNMFNILAVIAMPALVSPGAFDKVILSRDMPIMFMFSLALVAFAYGFKGEGKINRIEGGMLCFGFMAYLFCLYVQA
jgi:cation:H+ antiporter